MTSISKLRLLIALLILPAACAATPGISESQLKAQELETREAVMEALKEEIQRSKEKLTFRDFQNPYYVGFIVRDIETRSVHARWGGVTQSNEHRHRVVYTEVRVGDYQFDNFANIDAESFRFSDFNPDRRAAIDNRPDVLRSTLWLLADEAYKKAISDYSSKRGGAVYATDERLDVPSFSQEQPVRARSEVKPLTFSTEKWEELARKISGQTLRHPDLIDASVDVTANRTIRYIANSEGTDIVDEATLYSVHITVQTRAEDGMLLDHGISLYARDHDQLPTFESVDAHARRVLDELMQLRAAPTMEPYTGPVLLEPEASGVLFHEAVGHRLEGERQRDEEEGRTFKDRVGQVVIPEFLSIYDDPLLTDYMGFQLNGHYQHDDEGVPAQRANLVEDGVLRGFLLSRTPIEGFLQSNGHGRAQLLQKPMARMSNLVVAANPDSTVSRERLKEMLLEETRRQGKPYGLIVRDITGGSTNTSQYGYQAFKGASRMVYRVDPETGEETLVRGVELVGTPLAAINKIVAASQETGVFNGFCGAESGYVPVSTIAPALLVTEVEFQRTQRSTERPPILPPPWAE